jgi:hypothetical protein
VACRAIGRRTRLPAADEEGAMQVARSFWGLMRLLFLMLFVAPLVIVGIIDHTLLGGGPLRAVMAVFFGAFILAFAADSITYFRLRYLSDGEASWVDGDGNQHRVRLRSPKPYDSLISFGTGLFAATMLLTQT